MDDGADPSIDLDLVAVAAALGAMIVAVATPAWGDRGSTFRLDLADGRQVAARRGAGSTGRTDTKRIAAVMGRLAAAGLPVPSPVVVETAQAGWLVTPWIDGATGAAWLTSPDRARQLAERMGRLAGRLRAVDPGGLDVPRDHATTLGIGQNARGWLADTGSALDGPTRTALDTAIDRLASSPDRPAVVAHGDFAPINVIVDADGGITGLLDLEHARLGPPLLDVAWWGWIVRHHHPDAWSASWPTFLSAAAVDPGEEAEREIHALQLVRLLEAAAAAGDAAIRARWLDRLVVAARW